MNQVNSHRCKGETRSLSEVIKRTMFQMKEYESFNPPSDNAVVCAGAHQIIYKILKKEEEKVMISPPPSLNIRNEKGLFEYSEVLPKRRRKKVNESSDDTTEPESEPVSTIEKDMNEKVKKKKTSTTKKGSY